jgi:hypothetical protein
MSDDEERPPAHSHLIDFPEALEMLFGRMSELRLMVGPRAAAGVDEIERLLREGLAARQRGDAPAGAVLVGEAMERLSQLAAREFPGEAAVMRGMTERFQGALRRGSLSDAKQTADVMRERSGSSLLPKKNR